MIRYLEAVKPEQMPISWWGKVKALSKPRRFTFKKGLNILWGPNGSGKTTVLLALARLLHCEQGGSTTLTQTSLAKLFDAYRRYSNECTELKGAVKLSHDGQAVRHFDPARIVGYSKGMFDWDFGLQGIAGVMYQGSSGQTTLNQLDGVLSGVVRREVPEIDFRISEHGVNSLWADRIKTAKRFLKGTGKKGPPTILLDEPERSLDLDMQLRIWSFIRRFAQEVQIIVASHSFFALRLPEAHYIEMTPGYLEKSLEVLEALQGWSGVEVGPPPPPPPEEPEVKKKPRRRARRLP